MSALCSLLLAIRLLLLALFVPFLLVFGRSGIVRIATHVMGEILHDIVLAIWHAVFGPPRVRVETPQRTGPATRRRP